MGSNYKVNPRTGSHNATKRQDVSEKAAHTQNFVKYQSPFKRNFINRNKTGECAVNVNSGDVYPFGNSHLGSGEKFQGINEDLQNLICKRAFEATTRLISGSKLNQDHTEKNIGGARLVKKLELTPKSECNTVEKVHHESPSPARDKESMRSSSKTSSPAVRMSITQKEKDELHSLIMHLKSLDFSSSNDIKDKEGSVDSSVNSIDSPKEEPSKEPTHSQAEPHQENVTNVKTYVCTSCKNGPRRKAVIIGCNYAGGVDDNLRGSCNDAALFAIVLITKMGYCPQDILLLLDSEPADVYKEQLSRLSQYSEPQVKRGAKPSVFDRWFASIMNTFGGKPEGQLDLPEMMALDSQGPLRPDNLRPTRANILKAVRWLTHRTVPGDCCIFYYSGHSVQIDDLSGWEGEGYDEALVPVDYTNGVIPALQLRRMLQCVDKCCQMNIILDTCGLQTILDSANGWGHIKGAKLRGIWPVIEATGKMKEAKYDDSVWSDPYMQLQMTRPKFIPRMEVDCVSNLTDPFLSTNHSTASANSICIAAAPWESIAVEALFRPLYVVPMKIPQCAPVVCHGVFTYCLANSLLYDARKYRIQVSELINGINRRIDYLRKTRLRKLDQIAQVTLHPSGLASVDDLFGSNWGGTFGSQRLHTSLDGINIESFLQIPQAWMEMHTDGQFERRQRQHSQQFANNQKVNRQYSGLDKYRSSSVSNKGGNGPFVNRAYGSRGQTAKLNRIVYIEYPQTQPINGKNWYGRTNSTTYRQESIYQQGPRIRGNVYCNQRHSQGVPRSASDFPTKHLKQTFPNAKFVEPITATLLSRLPTCQASQMSQY
ncbi:ICE-like protease caspase p20 domain-containing protein [Theileria equi strain WA]|uniref:ICE-like protease caspase p20 domain-containing protein n=1 Tax=Theileria equi strain WA TaxID=1537102 RepID=L0B1N6_THEEQ|nr:ICE-like protease caspase p20 domain-containing protein [Theileria equi strain WA]AFZ81383.1 ICE-like protease caspase p20 domain-containing protein [Theileria equi strain WA]|eukprot:XP_004831049.1 ICE-like protease caspase p20 domain-containing protein [Theileria equi strain WA]